MRQSQLPTKTLKEAPKDEQSTSAILLTRAGFIDKLAAGIYSFLPLGLRSLKKIENIIRKEMLAINGQEILLPALHPKENWEKTDRWAHFDALFKLKGFGDKEYALGATHEEIIAPLAKKFVFSYKDLPFSLFQFQLKFRNETRAKSGILRTREFIMKDHYSFHASQEDLDQYYDQARDAYFKIFERCGLDEKTYLTLASGDTFAKYSHEFQTLTEAGEDVIHICQNCDLAINEEIKAETPVCPDCDSADFKTAKAVEVGNIFKLGTKYSAPFDLKYRAKDGQEQTVIMGCYGIGLARLMGAAVEISHDENGIIWPKKIAPFDAHLITVNGKQLTVNNEIKKAAEKLEAALKDRDIEILYDDREEISAGQKFAEADLIGLPWRIVVSEKTLAQNKVEIKKRSEDKVKLMPVKDALKMMK